MDGATGESLTYPDLLGRVLAQAEQFRAAGIAPGDRVGILGVNSLPYAVTLLALSEVGAIAVPQNTRLHAAELTTNLQDAGVTALVADSAHREAATSIADDLVVVARFLLDGTAEGWTPLDRAAATVDTATLAATPVPDESHGEATSTILYTSGTTGRAKGCMLAQRTWVGYAQNMTSSLRMNRDDTYLAFLPLFHVAGLGLLHSQLILGGTVVTQAAADPAQMHAAVKKHGVTIVMVVPGISGPFVTHPDAAPAGDTTLRLLVSAVGLESREVIEATRTRLGVEYMGIYGQTESGTKTTWATQDQVDRNPSTYGTVMPALAYRLVDDAGRDVAPGEPGELLLRGSTVMQGYWNRPAATAETLAGGWHHTGDVFVLQDDGTLRMVDRTKYLIKTGGENVYPQEVENILKVHPKVADVAVAGIPDAEWGETVKAFVIPEPGVELTRAELDEAVRTEVAGYKAPRFIEFVDQIPRNVSGKILKNELTARPTDESQRVARKGRSRDGH
ncbi:AMP-binding protein [Dietzia sp. B32]|nr:AMP-binding protein [Dietzia sp. B32]